MEVRIVVTCFIEPDSESGITKPTVSQMREACETAIRRATEAAEQNGFEHPLAYEASITVLGVEAD